MTLPPLLVDVLYAAMAIVGVAVWFALCAGIYVESIKRQCARGNHDFGLGSNCIDCDWPEACPGHTHFELADPANPWSSRPVPIKECFRCSRYDWGLAGQRAQIQAPPLEMIQRFGECPRFVARPGTPRCDKPRQLGKSGWKCKRHEGHGGPCAAVPTGLNRLRVWWRLR